MTYNCNFDDKKCRRDTVVDWKAYSTDQVGGVEVWIEDILQLANRWRIDKAGILLVQILS